MIVAALGILALTLISDVPVVGVADDPVTVTMALAMLFCNYEDTFTEKGR